MIDWLSFVIPCAHPAPINDGEFQRVDAEGNVSWRSNRRLSLRASYDSSVTVRSANWIGSTGLEFIEVSGNLVKFFQGHNLWGSDDVLGLVFEFMRWLALEQRHVRVTPTEHDIAAWKAGHFPLTRVDVTANFHVGIRADALAWIRAGAGAARMRNGRPALLKGDTLYFDPGSRRRTLKIYAKGQEIEANAEHQPSLLYDAGLAGQAILPHVMAYADGLLRAELTLRSMELDRLGLRPASAWAERDGVPFDPLQLLRDRLGTMTMTTIKTLPAEVFETLTSGQRTAYLAWVAGNDLRSMLSNGAFYNLRRKLLPHVDICNAPPKADGNVIPLIRVIEATPAAVPDWAVGTPLLFEPRRVA